jgi:hypothetical protein
MVDDVREFKYLRSCHWINNNLGRVEFVGQCSDE